MHEEVTSVNGVRIRLTDERWAHITEEHSELAGLRFEVLEAVQQPDKIVKGSEGALVATRLMDDGKYLVVIYREISSDGFIITAFLTRRTSMLERRELVWLAPK